MSSNSGVPLRLMAVHAHPDDESSKGAATTARYVAEGVEVMVVSCTGGERGDVLNERLKGDPHIQRDLTQVRREEMAEAARILGVRHVWLGFVDSGLPEGDPLPPLPEGCFALEPVDVTTEALVRVMRDFRPHVVTTYDENGGYPHPDHIMTHVVTMAAWEAVSDPAAFPHAGEPWQPQKLYYNGWDPNRMRLLDEAMVEAGLEPPFAGWRARTDTRPRRVLTTRVPVSEHFETRDDALRAHATQVDPDGHWFAVPLEIQRRVWPTEDFELARSMVAPALPEDDLFAGLRGRADLDEVCRAPVARDEHGAPVVAHVGAPPVPPPGEGEDAGEPDEPRPDADTEAEIGDDEGEPDRHDAVREQEGHSDGPEEGPQA